MNTEITDNKVGLVLYDGECSLCLGWAKKFEGVLLRTGFNLTPLQAARPELPLTEMRLVTPEGEFGGAEACVQIARRIWWAWPLYAVAQLPGMMRLLRFGYQRLADNRHCIGGACRLTGRKLPGAWIPCLVLPAAVLLLRDELPAWVFMWLLALAMFVGCKWLTLALAIRNGARPSSFRSASYILAWVGMDAGTFLDLKLCPAQPSPTEWRLALAKTFLGAALIWFGARLAMPVNPLLAGWIGMMGVVFLLHFGLFHLMSLAWRWAGVNATQLMRAPLLSRSVAEFWGRRWNTAFHELVHRFTFRPLCRRVGAVPAMLGVFLLSGLIHDLVISLPARGGFGLPTVYFFIQGLGVLVERSRLGRKIGLGHSVRGWCFTVIVAGGPAFWLFHPPFINNVILPMLDAIGAA